MSNVNIIYFMFKQTLGTVKLLGGNIYLLQKASSFHLLRWGNACSGKQTSERDRK